MIKNKFTNQKLRYTILALSGFIPTLSTAQTIDNPIDMTDRLANPDFEIGFGNVPGNGGTVRDLPYGWSHNPADELVPKDALGTPAWGITSGGQTSGKNLCWYNSVPMPNGFMLYQDITGLPAGIYVVTCDLCAMGNYTDPVDIKTTQRLFANNVVQYYGSETDYSAAQLTDDNEIRSFANHTWMSNNLGGGFVLQPMSVTVSVDEGETLRLGIKTTTVLYDGTVATNAAGFFKVDNFKLKQIASPTTAKENLTKIINTAEEFLNSTEIGSYDGQYLKEEYDKVEAVISEARSLVDNNETNIDKLIEMQNKVQNAIDAYKATMIQDTYTSLIINNDFEDTENLTPDNGTQVYRHDPPGWNRTGEIIGNSKGFNPEGEGRHGTFSCWYNSVPMPEFELSQTIEAKSETNPDGLPAGNYELSCLMWIDNNITTQRIFANDYSMYFGKEENYGQNIVEGEKYDFAGLTPNTATPVVLQELVLPFALGEGEDLKLGIRTNNIFKDGTAATNNAGWFRTDYFRLQYRGVEEFSLNETETYSNNFNKETVCNVDMTRNLKSDKWNTICLPFGLNKEQAAKYFSDIRVLNGISAGEESYILEFSDKLEEMTAGVPYIVKVNSDITELNFENVIVEEGNKQATPVTVSDGNISVTMSGNYSPIEKLDNVYFISGNKFYFADNASNVKMNAFRAFITINGDQVFENSPMIMSIDGNGNDGTTGIKTANAENDTNKPVYNICGQKIANDSKQNTIDSLPKGIYIINGKKFIKQ